MIYGVVLAGGVGSRMGNVGKPKQYLLVGDKPILIHTLEKFYMQSEFEKVLVLCPTEWITHTKNLVKKYMKMKKLQLFQIYTIVCSEDNVIISDIPERRKMYQGQTPQTFKALKLRQLYEALSPKEKELLTDAAKIFVMKGEKVHIVDGEVFNIKITYPYDLRVAEALIKGEGNEVEGR